MGIIERIIAIISEEVSTELLTRIDGVLARRLGQYSKAIVDQIKLSEENQKMLFTQYQADNEAGLDAILVAIGTEGEEIQALVKAALDGDSEAIQAGAIRLAEKRRDVIDAIAGLSTKLQSPVVPTPLPEPTPDQPVPVPPAPEPIPAPAPPVIDPEVPVVVVPSPEGTGVDGGFEVSPG